MVQNYLLYLYKNFFKRPCLPISVNRNEVLVLSLLVWLVQRTNTDTEGAETAAPSLNKKAQILTQKALALLLALLAQQHKYWRRRRRNCCTKPTSSSVTQRRGAMKARKKKRKVYYIFICYIGEEGIRAWAQPNTHTYTIMKTYIWGRAE